LGRDAAGQVVSAAEGFEGSARPMPDIVLLGVIEEIRQLKARYFRLMDTKRWDEWGEVFATHARMEIPESGTVLRGRAEIVDRVRTILAAAVTVHHGHMPEIEVLGPKDARGTWAMTDHVTWTSAAGEARGFRGYGHYHEHYVVEGGAWRIAATRLERLHKDRL
jgi:hypothetical protein